MVAVLATVAITRFFNLFINRDRHFLGRRTLEADYRF